MKHMSNRILAALPKAVFAAMEPHLKIVTLNLGDVISEAGGVVRQVIFPQSAVISLVVDLSTGLAIETAMTGRDGVVNAGAALDGKISLNKSIVQLAGRASTIDAKVLGTIADQFKVLQSLLLRHEQVLFAQSQQSVACNARHSLEARMCRWLMRMRDLTDGDDLKITQEFLAQMLGVQRPSVTLVANTLKNSGLIDYRRGSIRILDAQAMRKSACECYETVRAHYSAL